MTEQENGSNLERLLRAYVGMRDRRSQLKREFDEQDGALKKKMGLVETQLLKMLNAAGSDSLKVAGVGQAYLGKRVMVSVRDWDAFWNHVIETKHIDLLQKRVASRAVQEFLETEGELPPGVDMSTERVVNVRRD